MMRHQDRPVGLTLGLKGLGERLGWERGLDGATGSEIWESDGKEAWKQVTGDIHSLNPFIIRKEAPTAICLVESY